MRKQIAPCPPGNPQPSPAPLFLKNGSKIHLFPLEGMGGNFAFGEVIQCSSALIHPDFVVFVKLSIIEHKLAFSKFKKAKPFPRKQDPFPVGPAWMQT